MLEDLGRIEVISGPGGTLSRANTTNRVVKIITRAFYATDGALVSAGVGNQGQIGSARYGDKLGERRSYQGDLYRGTADQPGISDNAIVSANAVARRRSKALFLAALCAALCAAWPVLAANPHEEDEVEAAFLYRFAGYVDWPPQALSGRHFTIAVLGSDNIAQELERILPHHSLKSRPAQVRRIRSLREARDAQILFVGPEFNDELKSIISRVDNHPVLVVSASDHGLDDGSCVNFLFVDQRVRFEVSLTAADHVGLRVSSELLSVAVRVQGRSLHSGASGFDIDRPAKFSGAATLAGDSK